ncbi:bile acid:sodium symporter family protein [Janibacter sp. G349]|uniref:bile acid:sodium symporter family protein n=1 Tax=unclassified Janibacter TaxID=2649294 RepID=UPI0020CD2A6D|nr:bile acid:sodium symporter family protein [Janibacter sp. CX7]UTT66287.1 bile acid:sodium symporter family protein [Janibacter sp. CX7]
MDQSPALTIGLPIAIGIVMLGLGLSLTRADFTRVREAPRAVVVALGLQMLFLPVLAYGLIRLFDLDPLLAVGVMLLAAAPGGTTAGMFSYLFRGDVALNITLTALNSILCIVTLPLITGWAVNHFDAGSEGVGVQLGKFASVVAVVLVPVAIGMWIRSARPTIAERAERPIRIFAIVFLVLVAIGAIVAERDNVVDYAQSAGVVVALLCGLSLTLGYVVARLLRLSRPQGVATAFEVGIHNTTLAMTLALSVMGSTEIAIPAAVYSIVMNIFGFAFGIALNRMPERAVVPAV